VYGPNRIQICGAVWAEARGH